jgi:starch synthase
VTIVAPRFAGFEAGGLSVARRLTPLAFTLGDAPFECTVFDGRLPSQVDLTLIDCAKLFDREGVYGKNGEDYPDNALRFAVFSRAVAELAKLRAAAGSPFDVLQLNDWPCALVPSYVKTLASTEPALARSKTVLTLHNVAHQGVFPKDVLPSLGLAWDAFTIDGIEFYGGINVLKQGIVTADALTTVSDTYAREIQTPAHGGRLDGVLAARGAKLTGIVNGVDASVWNPATDPALPARFDAEDASAKARCKGALQKELGLALDAAAPLVACVGRIVEQKGTDLFAQAMPKILRATDAQIVVVGDGDASIVRKIEDAVAKSNGRAVFARAASEPVAHRVFGAADLVVVPSRFEPCGLVQLYAQRYGAPPVARATGGLVDTIVDCDAKLETGTGFLFQEDTADALLGAVERGIAARGLPKWPVLVRRVMRLDRGWERAARKYEGVYKAVSA